MYALWACAEGPHYPFSEGWVSDVLSSGAVLHLHPAPPSFIFAREPGQEGKKWSDRFADCGD